MKNVKNILSYCTNAFLIAIVLALCAVIFLKLNSTLYSYDVQQIKDESRRATDIAAKTGDTPGTKLDEILIEHISTFNYARSFDHLLEKGPIKTVLKNALRIDQCEVSQSNFLKFVQWQKLNPSKKIQAANQPSDWKYESSSHEHIVSGKLTAPANGVTFYDAYAYCKASGGRLPYSDEWIAVATGQAQRLYPWGNAYAAEGLPYLDPLLNAAQKCGAHKETQTPRKVQDMGHNVSEWAANRENPLKPFVMGGNAYNTPHEIYALNFLYRYAPIAYRSPYVGFRCVYDKLSLKTPWLTKIRTINIPPGEYSIGMPPDSKVPSLMAKILPKQLDIIGRLFKQKQKNTDDELFLMTSEVTRQQYRHFLNDPFVKLGLYADKKQPDDHSYIPPHWEQQMEEPDLPVVYVDWWSAQAFSVWAGGRLPSAEEWIVAASNNGKHIYPWGNEFDEQVHSRPHSNKPHAPKNYHIDKTENGLFDMGGNLSEWTQSVTTSDGGYAIVVKGGNYLLPGEETARIDFSNYVSPNYRSPTLGFRVAFDRDRKATSLFSSLSLTQRDSQ